LIANVVALVAATVVVCALVYDGATDASPVASVEPDQCLAKVPDSLRHLLTERFPDYRLPEVADQLPDDIALDEKYGGDGCFTVAVGEFGGRRLRDVAILLPDKDASKVKLIGAIRDDGGWKIFELPTWCGTPRRCYVKVQKPGIYLRTRSLSGSPADSSERRRIRSRHDSVLSGTLESTGIVYVFNGSSWEHVWVSN